MWDDGVGPVGPYRFDRLEDLAEAMDAEMRDKRLVLATPPGSTAPPRCTAAQPPHARFTHAHTRHLSV